jgi:hypothetical protein
MGATTVIVQPTKVLRATLARISLTLEIRA